MEKLDEDTLRMLRDSASAFTKGSASRVRGARESQFRYGKSVWKQMASQGWLSAAVPEEKGGMGLGNAAVGVIAAQIGREALPEPYVTAGVIPTTLISACGSGPRHEEMLSAITSGEVLCAVAWQNEAGSLFPNDTPLVATTVGDDVLITGEACHVMACGLDAVIAVARTSEGLGLYWVPITSGNPGITLHERADWGYDSTISFEKVRVPGENRIAVGPSVEHAVNAAIDAGLVAVSSELSGVAAKMLDMTLEYLRTRHQFGKPIGSFQALKHRAVDLWMHSEISTEVSHSAARSLDDPHLGAGERSAVASGAKARASDTALLVGKQAIQMHGAIGITDEYDLSLYFNRAIVLASYLGNGAVHRARYTSYRDA